MNRKIKLLGVTVMAALMILLAFSGLAHNNGTMDKHSEQSLGVPNMIVRKHNNITTLNTQEMHDLQEFMKYNLIHYGLHSGKLDKLQYKADMNFLTWYIGNFSQIPSAYRGITQQNASVMLPIWENESVQAQSDVQAVANYEVNQHTSQYHINTAYIVYNRLGNLVSNRTTMYNNESANLLVYKYTKNNESLVYELIDQKGSFIPVDPYIRLNAFTIHWGWGGLISGTSYNMYFTFATYSNALTFKNFLSSALTAGESINAAVTILAWTALGAAVGTVVPGPGTLAGAFVGFAQGMISVLIDTVNPTTVASNLNHLFTNQEDYYNDTQFEIVYTLNAWEAGLTPEFSWWGYINPGAILYQIYKTVGFGGNGESDYINLYNYFTGEYGTNIEQPFSGPLNWYIVGSEVSSLITMPA
ncbi:MAG: hypothetical protein ACYCPR_02220 [Thermoplasmataceae archaeon]